MKRRRFLQVAGVTSAGVATGCATGEPDKLMPYLVPHEDLIPGIPTHYASTCRECAAGCGIIVKTREARAIKIEGNPEHPVNRGRLCARGQAGLQGLYDADRLGSPMRKDGTGWRPITWDDAQAEIVTALSAAAVGGADRVALLTGAGTGVVDAAYDRFMAAFRSTRRLRYEAFAYESLRDATRQVFGVATMPRYDFAAARYIISFGADFLETWVSPTEFARGFAAAHGFEGGHMAKYVACEPRRGQTSFSADEWVPPAPGTEHLLALGIANAVIRSGKARVSGADADRLRGFLARFDLVTVSRATGVSAETITRIADEFATAQPSLAVAGGVAGQHRAATQVAVAAHLLNVVAGNVGQTSSIPAASAWDRVDGHAAAMRMIETMNAGTLDVAFVHGTNPAFTLPESSGFAEAFAKVRLKVAFVTTIDETAQLADIILPAHHALESWDAVEPVAGITSFQQPVMNPIGDSRQPSDVLLALATLAGRPVSGAQTARDLVAAGRPNLNALLAGGVAGTAAAARGVRVGTDFARLTYEAATFDGAADGLAFLPVASTLFDGRGANKPWLQELPDPATKIAWQTWVEVHPLTAERLALKNGDVVRVSAGEREAHALVYVWPGIVEGAVAMPIGQGHTSYGRHANSRGANPFAMLSATAVDGAGALALSQLKVSLAKTGDWRPLATTEGSARQHGRGIAQMTTFAAAVAGHVEHEEHPITPAERRSVEAGAEVHRRNANLGEYAAAHPKWEMVIDLSRCTGCSACVTACYAENNLPTVGEDQVVRSREMAWIRIERYLEGDTAGHGWGVAQIPMLCQQCANAPCEPVCPVYAAYHTPDGLNGQIYNRCVGTRYCANNCPYKVRYFNFWDYGAPNDPKYSFAGALHLALNPDVTVRTKGVMEKCTFCVQRIRYAQNTARVRGTPLRDGEIATACEATCPAEAIVFGDANDPASRLSRAKQNARGYTVFPTLNTQPGITYLQRVVHAGEAH